MHPIDPKRHTRRDDSEVMCTEPELSLFIETAISLYSQKDDIVYMLTHVATTRFL